MHIARLIRRRMEELNLTRVQLVREALGYANITRGLRHLDRYLAGEPFNLMDVSRYAKALQITAAELLDAMIQDEKDYQAELQRQEQEQKAKDRANFRPYFYSVNERKIPQPIFAGNLTHYMRFVFYYKEFAKLPLEQQLQTIKFDIVDHYNKNKGTSRLPALFSIIFIAMTMTRNLKMQSC